MNVERLNEIKARLAAATPGPWWRDDQFRHIVGGAGDRDFFVASTSREEDAEFIAHARQDIEDLLKEMP